MSDISEQMLDYKFSPLSESLTDDRPEVQDNWRRKARQLRIRRLRMLNQRIALRQVDL